MSRSGGKKGKSIGAILVLIILALIKWKYPHLLGENSEKKGDYEVYRNCRLVDHRGNDGDSFHAIVNGETEELRLYFVDTPESAIKKYRDGNSNIKRVQQQANYFESIEVDDATDIGKKAKAFTQKVLKKGFNVYTAREFVYGPPRIYAFVEVEHKGEKRFLHELLVEKGYARIYTKPLDLPDGTRKSKQLSKLRKMEKIAKSSKLGGWGK